MRVTLLGFTVPDEVYDEIAATDSVLPAQTNRFAWALVESLRQGGVQEVGLVSAAPVSSYPGNRRIVWRWRRWSARGTPGVSLPFLNLPVLKHLTRFIACWVVAAPELRRRKSDWLIVHGVHSPFLWFAVLYAQRSSCRTCVVLTDPPGVVRATDGRVIALLKKFDIWFVRRALTRCDAVIALSPRLASDFAPGVPAIVMEGIASVLEEPLAPEEPAAAERPLVVYAGGIQREYGVLSLVKAVAGSDLDVELRIFGKGPDEDEVRAGADCDERVVGPALVAPAELPDWYRRAAALVQPRPVHQDFVPYSFPSKLIEYLSSGVPVITTRLPSIPDDYAPFVIWAEPDTPDGIRAALREVTGWSREERSRFGRAGADFIRGTRSTQAQGRRIVAFLDALALPPEN